MLIPVLEYVSNDHIVVVLPAEFQFCVNERNSWVVCSGSESFFETHQLLRVWLRVKWCESGSAIGCMAKCGSVVHCC